MSLQQHPSPQLTVYLRRYRSAIALSNVAVRLLERRAYGQAAKALEEAKALIESVARISLEPIKPGISSLEEGTCGEDLVNQSLRQLSNPLRTAKRDLMVLEVLTTGTEGSLLSSKTSVLDFVLAGSPSSTTAFPIRMEEYLTCDWMDGHSCYLLLVQRQSSIISHNLAIAYRCLCQSPTDDVNRTELLQYALFHAQESSFRLVQQLAFLPAEERLKWYCLALAALNSLLQVQQELGQDAVECYGAMLELRSALMCHQESTLTDLVWAGAAAAA